MHDAALHTPIPVSELVRPLLYDAAACKALEADLAAKQAPHALMAQAGRATARLALALAPHARTVWVACGPGNNGGDGLVAALHLHQWGKQVFVTTTVPHEALPTDAQWAYAQLQRSGIHCHPFTPEALPNSIDLVIDALLGIGANRPPTGVIAQAIASIHQRVQSKALVLAVDIPSGLHADTGASLGESAVQAHHTLSLLALHPGLFTAMGRQLSGRVWLSPLGVGETPSPVAVLGDSSNQAASFVARGRRSHASHKGLFGDVAVIGGADGMQGAAILAAQAALQSGAGRVYLCLLAPSAGTSTALPCADVMQNDWRALDLSATTVVCGCGGGAAMAQVLPQLLQTCPQLVLDADALNALASHPELQEQLAQRASKGWFTVLTPHPKEAARCLGWTVQAVQSQRLQAATRLSQQWGATVVLKGSGTVIASPNRLPTINQTGNGKLAIAGTGDVLAGLMGTCLAHEKEAHRAAEQACFWHGWVADQCPTDQSLTASQLLTRLPTL